MLQKKLKQNKPLKGVVVGIVGFGTVGRAVSHYLSEWGADIWVSDIKPIKTKFKRFNLVNVLGKLKFDVLILCACNDVLNGDNIDFIDTRLIIEGGNCQMSDEIKKFLRKRRGVRIIDDYIANAGGVITSHLELRGFNLKGAFEVVEEKMK